MQERITTTLAWRNVWRNKRRTVLTLLTILTGCTMIILLNAFAKGGHDQMIEDAVAVNAGHIQIHEKGFWENRTIDYAFKDETDIEEILNDLNIKSYSKRILSAGLLSHKGNTAGAVIQGVDPEKEITVTNINTKILPGGRYLKESDLDQILLGETLAKNIDAETGSKISMISQGFDGSIAARQFEVVGLFRTGNSEYDNTLLIMPFKQAAEVFTMMGFINSIVIRADEISSINTINQNLKELLSIKSDSDFEIMGWDELMPELVQFIVMDDISAYIFDFILFMVVAFGVLNTIQMSVFERTRETGIMLSIGTRPSQIVKMIMFESVIIAVIGIALGLLIGYSLSYYFQINPLDYSDYTKEMEVWGVSTTRWPAEATLLNISVTALITFILSFVFTIFPAKRASKLNPIEAIRQL
ncbi:MAG: ABC transporter permease [Spirochaetes bacterium]|nr:ABC transporter permease [Spirochaetota bacterium]